MNLHILRLGIAKKEARFNGEVNSWTFSCHTIDGHHRAPPNMYKLLMNYLASLPSTIADIPFHRLPLSGLTHNDVDVEKNFPGLLHTAPGGGRKGPKPIQRFRLSFFVGQIGSADVFFSQLLSLFWFNQPPDPNPFLPVLWWQTVMFSWS